MIQYQARCQNCYEEKNCGSTHAADWWAYLHAIINRHNVEICELWQPYPTPKL